MADFLTLLLKMVLTVLLLPLVVGAYFAFREHLIMYPLSYGEFFFWGVVSFVAIYLFFYQFWSVHEAGDKVTSGMFKFIQPFDKVVVYIIPIYPIITALIYLVVSRLTDEAVVRPYFLFFIGFFSMMHVILHAQELQELEKSVIKPTYYFWMVFILLAVFFTTVLLMDMLAQKWTFGRFCQMLWEKSVDYYWLSVKKVLFLK